MIEGVRNCLNSEDLWSEGDAGRSFQALTWAIDAIALVHLQLGRGLQNWRCNPCRWRPGHRGPHAKGHLAILPMLSGTKHNFHRVNIFNFNNLFLFHNFKVHTFIYYALMFSYAFMFFSSLIWFSGHHHRFLKNPNDRFGFLNLFGGDGMAAVACTGVSSI